MLYLVVENNMKEIDIFIGYGDVVDKFFFIYKVRKLNIKFIKVKFICNF